MASIARWWTIDSSQVFDAAAPLDVAGGISPRAEEGVLDDVLGEGGVVRDAVGDRVGHRPVSVVQLLESIELSVGDPGEHSPIRLVRRATRCGAGAAGPPVVIW